MNIPFKSYLRKIKRMIKPAGGTGFPGGGRQQLRSRQIKIMEDLKLNPTFISCFPELLACNESHKSLADKYDIGKEMRQYFESLKTWDNYSTQVPNLQGWVDPVGHKWPNIHPALRHVVDTYSQLKPATVCEVGAGAGVVAKYIYAASNQTANITCVEGAPQHLKDMEMNFSGTSDIISPNIKVNAKIIKGAAQALPLADNSMELVYTCTLMMHIPYIAAVLAACEFARVSSRYILHVEGYHTDGVASFRKSQNLLVPDYERLYALLGFKTIKKIFYQDPYAKEYDYIVFLAEKQT